jgi:Lrp/AsnC family transcriptional regulator, leucine-responsive regulatory protein
MSLDLDNYDKEILRCLQSDSSISNVELAARIGLSTSACLGRTKRLKEIGVIRQYAAIVDEKTVGIEVIAFTFVNLVPHNRLTDDAFIRKVKEHRQIMECHNTTGEWDYLLKIVSPDIKTYRDFIIDTLMEFPGVNKVETTIVLKTDKQSFDLPID